MAEPAAVLAPPSPPSAGAEVFVDGGAVNLLVREASGHDAHLALTPELARRLAAELTHTASRIDPPPAAAVSGLALAGAMRRNLELLAELDKAAPAEVDRILSALLAHIRSWRPQLLGEVKP